MQTKLLIAGKLVEGQGALEQVLDAARGTTIAEVNEASPSQIEAAVNAAESAFGGWSQTPPRDRAAALLKTSTSKRFSRCG